jgi:hypothetical protein
MGYAFCVGHCIACGRQFTFNPVKVPSVRVEGRREPVCASCVTKANEQRKAAGMEPHFVHPDAYEACNESELG